VTSKRSSIDDAPVQARAEGGELPRRIPVRGTARAGGPPVLADPADKPHGLREACIADQHGHVWVPDIPIH
jgi:hypothetical protein